jgi:uncharacterized protein (DUF736 family)
MRTTIGRFIKDPGGLLQGRIYGLGLRPISVVLEPQTSKEGKPYFKVIADPLIEPHDVGSAFERQKDGMTYYAVALDSLVFATPMNVALFPDKETAGTFNLVLEREPSKAKLGIVTGGSQRQSQRSAGSGQALV